MSREDVRAYYDQYGEREWERLTRPADGIVEQAINQHTIAQHGLTKITLLSSEGFAPDIQDHLTTLAVTDPDAYRTVFDALLRTAAEPSILGMSHHLLYVGQKRYECGQELQDEQDFDS